MPNSVQHSLYRTFFVMADGGKSSSMSEDVSSVCGGSSILCDDSSNICDNSSFENFKKISRVDVDGRVDVFSRPFWLYISAASLLLVWP